jgi:hypothetical protein
MLRDVGNIPFVPSDCALICSLELRVLSVLARQGQCRSMRAGKAIVARRHRCSIHVALCVELQKVSKSRMVLFPHLYITNCYFLFKQSHCTFHSTANNTTSRALYPRPFYHLGLSSVSNGDGCRTKFGAQSCAKAPLSYYLGDVDYRSILQRDVPFRQIEGEILYRQETLCGRL